VPGRMGVNKTATDGPAVKPLTERSACWLGRACVLLGFRKMLGRQLVTVTVYQGLQGFHP
jgi:hypothetical protein